MTSFRKSSAKVHFFFNMCNKFDELQFFCKSRKKFVGIKIMLYICSKFFTSMTKRNCFLLFWALIAVCNYGYARFTCKGKVKDSDYTFFEGMNPDAQGKRIDYIYVRNGKVRHYRTIKNTYLRQWLPSDHIPVVCEVRRIFGMHKLF